MPLLTRFSKLPWLRSILCLAFALRVGAAVLVQQHVDRTGSLCLIAGDAEGYWTLARHIVLGQDYALYDPPRYVERMPGFPWLLALGIKLTAANVLAVRLLLAAVGTCACALVYQLGRELANRTVGLVACCLAAVSPTFIVFSVLLLSETLFAATVLASLWALAVFVRAAPACPVVATNGPPSGAPTVDWKWAGCALWAGAWCGVATLVRPTWIVVAPLFAVVYLFQAPLTFRRLAAVGYLLAGLAVVLAPWTIRNYRVTGHFVATTLWMGPSLYDGLSPAATGDSNMEFVERDGRYARRDLPDFEYQANLYYRRAAVDFARKNPGRALELSAHKLWRYLNPFPNAAQFRQPAIWWGVGLFEAPVLVFAVVGAWCWLRGRTSDLNSATYSESLRILPRTWRFRGLTWPLLLAAGPFVLFAAVHTVFVGSIRYRLPAEYALLVLTAAGLCWVAQTVWRRRADSVS
ncbi:MAG: glycosyltransferase family 39 protein [Planctomycetes bacterium]|nr:glycosyltransferase family 39 protein [Planctomycetota bacterium]